MTFRKAVKRRLYTVSPGLGAKCAGMWDAIQPLILGRLTAPNAAKYFFRGLCPGIGGKFTYYGTKVYFPWASRIFALTCEQGLWEPVVTEWLCRLAVPGKLFIDVGANIGLSSIPVLETVPGSRVLSFEPSPNTLSHLQRTWGGSKFQDRWEIVGKAAGDAAGSVPFYVATPEYGMCDGLQDTKVAGERRSVEIALTTVDTEWGRLKCPPVSCIKIDVEGAESKVLKGAEKLVRRERPFILLEWSPVNLLAFGMDPGFLLDYAAEHNYDVLTLENLSAVSELHILKFHMLYTQMFLLVPRPSPAGQMPAIA